MNAPANPLRLISHIPKFALVVILTLGAFISAAHAELKVHALFCDHMVLQQGVSTPVWGWADEGEVVTVTFRDQSVRATAKGGKWMVHLKKLKPGGPDTLTISTGSKTLTCADVLVGEVWVCSGQSNMEWPLKQSFEPETDIANSKNPMIRLFTVPRLKAESPVDNINSQWVECGPDTVPGFSAVGYYFGRELQKRLGVPVGLIHTSWGGTPAEAWTSATALKSNPRFEKEILQADAQKRKAYAEALARWEKSDKQSKKPTLGGTPPSVLYNGMIAPLLPFAIKGAIWYQGESNASRAEQYRSLFATMIRNWRRAWGQGDFPFLCVQLAPFKSVKDAPGESDWAELREAQWLATKNLPNVGMAVITDVGDPKDIHPKRKQPVGERLATAARGIAYGEKIEYSGPIYRKLKIRGNKAEISFDHVGEGLEARDGALKGFAICGEDRKWVWADAEIVGDKVVVSNPAVTRPAAVRYGWADCPVVNLWNKDGFPASPFRTDDFPMITAPKK